MSSIKVVRFTWINTEQDFKQSFLKTLLFCDGFILIYYITLEVKSKHLFSVGFHLSGLHYSSLCSLWISVHSIKQVCSISIKGGAVEQVWDHSVLRWICFCFFFHFLSNVLFLFFFFLLTGIRPMWTGWRPTSPSGLSSKTTSKSTTPQDCPGARLWVSKNRVLNRWCG